MTSFLGMELLDIIILVLIGIGVIQGLMKGFLKQLFAIVGLVAGLLIARSLYNVVAMQLETIFGTSITIAQIVSFILIWVIVPLLCIMVANVLTKALNAICLGWINRLLGGLFGALKVLLLIGLGIYVFEYLDPKGEIIGKTKKEKSALYKPVKEFTNIFFPVLKNMTDKIVN